MKSIALTVAALTCGIGLTARAETESSKTEIPISLGVTSGVIAGSGPWRAAPSIDLAAAVGIGRSHFAIVGGVGAWSFADAGTFAAQSEVVASIGAAVRGGLSDHWSWSVAAAPALAFVDQAQTPMRYSGGLLLAPTLEFSTRRRTLGLTLGTRAFFLSDGTRLGAVAGVAYTFR